MAFTTPPHGIQRMQRTIEPFNTDSRSFAYPFFASFGSKATIGRSVFMQHKVFFLGGGGL
ncbi:hypothetical protein BX666DRAFT_1955823 [Dichotomocladium elegans]|nr:hypothetical protein BX666DRAFT_1955823 [Dichotomocladium elegans]